MKAVFKISYYLRSNYKNKEGKCPVMIRISLNGKMCTVGSSGLSVNPDKWDNKMGRMKSKSAEAMSFNYKIDAITTSLNNIFKKFEQGEDLNVETIKSVYTGFSQNTETFISLFQKYNDDIRLLVGKTKSAATLQKYERAKNHFKEFLKKKYNRADLPFSEFTHIVLHDFEIYLKTTGKCSHNTTSKFIQSIRTICLFARNSGLTNHDPFANYRISFEKVDRGYLLDDEIKTILNKEFATERLSNVRDIFIFSCFTGLAYIDVANLTQDNLVENNGKFWIMTKRQKTNVASNILLLDIPLKIIEKHKGKTKEDKLLPILSNQKMNSYLKEIADVCGINKKLTYHTARHSFATTVTLSKGVPIETVSKMLGHTNIKTTQIYARITNEKIEKDMLSLATKLDNYAGL